MHVLIYLVPLLAIAALAFAAYKANYVSKMAPGSSRMQEISSAIAEGASAFLKSEYKILAVFILVLFILIAIFINFATALCFVAGAGCSILAGFFGMRVATKANVRTANAALEHGMNRALSVAFSGGSVMGMCVVGLGLLGCSLIYILTGRYDILFGFSLGASSIALFARVGGGIYTKAADVGADLVGKVEAGIPEDDPRNPAVIADNVGDNVGDVAGMGADLFESYVGAIVSAITLGVSAVGLFTGAGVIFPLAVAAVGIFASIIATFFVRGSDDSNPHKALKMGSYVSAVIVAVGAVILSYVFFGGLYCAAAIIAGLVVGLVIGFVTEVYTSEDYSSVKRIASQSETGSATTIISGIAVGMMSTWVPIVLICVGIYICPAPRCPPLPPRASLSGTPSAPHTPRPDPSTGPPSHPEILLRPRASMSHPPGQSGSSLSTPGTCRRIHSSLLPCVPLLRRRNIYSRCLCRSSYSHLAKTDTV